MTSADQHSDLSAGDLLMAQALAGGMTATAVAARFGVSVSSIYRRLRSRSFAAVVAAMKAEQLAPVNDQLRAELPRSVARLVALRDAPDTHPSSRVRACAAIIDAALKASELTAVEQRLLALEAALGGDRQ